MSLDNVRQPQPVEVIVVGDPRDVQQYFQRLCSFIERETYDTTTILKNTGGLAIFTIHPRAVND